MSLNSSSNDCLLDPDLSSINISLPALMVCLVSGPSSLVFATYNLANILVLLPLCILILYLGLQRWQRQRSSTTAVAMSHSDSFTYHMVAMEMVGVFGNILWCCGVYNNHFNVLIVGANFLSFTWFGQMCFHILTCVERYLAVVHPITYLSLRRERGIRIRNITIGCVWLLCVILTCLLMLESTLLDLCVLLFFLIVISFCSLSVLCVLTRPGPGEQGGDRQKVDQSKQRAFYTVMAILGVLFFRCLWSLISAVLFVSGGGCECLMLMCDLWFNLPSGLVLPVLFLQRSGKLMCCKNNIQ